MPINLTDNLKQALQESWDQELARFSTERWLTICEQNNWQFSPENLSLLAKLFGASWYFTRFVFFRGTKIKDILDCSHLLDFNVSTLLQGFDQIVVGHDLEFQFELLKIAKNEVMLKIFLAQLSEISTQEETEKLLTWLAEATLICAVHILLDEDIEISKNVSILAMGRMAGCEMNFGSDLDLIFLYSADEHALKISKFVRKLIHYLPALSPAGLLYEVDTRLRPHGNSGVLVTSAQSFIKYHKDRRDIWERQMMTRCRALNSGSDIANEALAQIRPFIYQDFKSQQLISAISTMRQMIVDEFKHKKDHFDLKNGTGGIMDIDFLTHYLQLSCGHEDELLHTASTREALRKLAATNRIDVETSERLLQAYNFLKSAEGYLRVFDMKPLNTLPKELHKVIRLARAMNYLNEDIQYAAQRFLDDYKNTAQDVRRIFNEVLK